MPRVIFTPHLQRHLDCPPRDVAGATLREALEAVFAGQPQLSGYLVDERFRLRKHVTLFVDGRPAADREGLSDPLLPTSEVYVMQALSGG